MINKKKRGLEKPEERLLPQTIEYVGDDHFLYASDVPHWDGEFPKNLKYLWNHPDLSRKTKEKIAYHNALFLAATILSRLARWRKLAVSSLKTLEYIIARRDPIAAT